MFNVFKLVVLVSLFYHYSVNSVPITINGPTLNLVRQGRFGFSNSAAQAQAQSGAFGPYYGGGFSNSRASAQSMSGGYGFGSNSMATAQAGSGGFGGFGGSQAAAFADASSVGFGPMTLGQGEGDYNAY